MASDIVEFKWTKCRHKGTSIRGKSYLVTYCETCAQQSKKSAATYAKMDRRSANGD